MRFPRASHVPSVLCFHDGTFADCRIARFNSGGRGERVARTERACRPQLLFSIGFFLLSLRGDWPFPRQTAQLRCTIIHLASSRARRALAIVRPLCHAAASLRRLVERGWRKKERERSVQFNRSHRALSLESRSCVIADIFSPDNSR